MKRFSNTAALRITGVALLVAAFGFLMYGILKPGMPETVADFFFLQTKEDADCTLLLSDGKSILIDTGEAQDFETIRELLRQQKVECIDCMILTHPDKDHIGSALALAQEFSVGIVVEPYYAKEKERYQRLNEELDRLGIPRMELTQTRQFAYGELRLTVYPPEKREYNKDNNYSLAVAVSHGRTSLFFAGDAYNARTKELLRLPLCPADVYHASYHGRDYENGAALLEALSPRNVIVTSDRAGVGTQSACDALGSTVFYTRSGTVHLQSSGNGVTRIP